MEGILQNNKKGGRQMGVSKYMWVIKVIRRGWYRDDEVLAVCDTKIEAQNWITQFGVHGHKYTIEKISKE